MSFPAQTTGLGVAAKILVQGNIHPGNTKPGYNGVVLSLSGADAPTTFQLNPEITDVSGAVVDPGTEYVLSAVAASTIGVLTLTGAAASVAGDTAYAGTFSGGGSNAYAGVTFTVAGFTNAGNNGSFICVASTTSALTLINPNGVLETTAATATPDEGTAVYTGTFTGATTGSLVGQTFVVTGFTAANNNGTFIVTANSGTTTVTLDNPVATAVTAAGTATAQEPGTEYVLSAVGNASAGSTVYTGTFTGATTGSLVGQTATITGFVTAANNGSFLITANTSTTSITVNNAAGVAVTAAGSAFVTSGPDDQLTFVEYGFSTLVPSQATGPNGTPVKEAIATVSASGLITAVALGGTVVEVSYPFANNTVGDVVSSRNIMNGLPINKVYAEVNVRVIP
jgi:hypothetical protein